MTRARTWLVLLVGYGLILVAVWTEGRTQLIWDAAAAAWIAAAVITEGRPLRELGLGIGGLVPALRTVAIALLAVGIIVLAGWDGGTLRPLYGSRPPGIHSFGYAIWALMQQVILNSFFYRGFERLLGNNRKAVAMTCLLFAGAHVPNPFLVPATLVGGWFFVEMFRRYRNLYPIAVAHAMLGIAIAMAVPDAIVHHMRVGIGYLHFYR
ncbi:MAG TPA: CPBP family intramembrane glutamic endopeptidase [Terriglobales bacterium]|nr:CPBP family intramembrane glutamic endopeptidase [Terriglobales bacterium]